MVARTYEAPPHVFGYPTRVPPFVTVHQPRYLINKGMMTLSPPPPTPARRFSNNNDDDDGRITCVVCIYIYIRRVWLLLLLSLLQETRVSFFKTKYQRRKRIIIYYIYFYSPCICVLTARETPRDVPILHTHIIYTYWYNILVLYTHYIYHIIRVYYVTHCECVVGNDIIV